jgi:DNA-binding NarL/FixJ family response regulator
VFRLRPRSIEQIAWQLKVLEHTVKFHISSIFNKLDVSNRTEAVTAGVVSEDWL